MGHATAEYPWRWSVRRWIPGRPATADDVGVMFAHELAAFLTALQHVDATGGPPAGAHSFHRGAPLAHYDDETRRAVAALGSRVDGCAALAVWDAALAAPWLGDPVWFHGDVAAGNLLVDDPGLLSAVIDFGICGVGDPACDLVIAWTLLHGDSRAAFRSRMPADAATWARARGWALWKALITLATSSARVAARAQRVVEAVVAEHAAA